MSGKRDSPSGPWMGAVAVMVSNRDAAKRWYTAKLGMQVIDDEDHWTTVGQPGVGGLLHLCQGSELGVGFPLEPGNTGILLRMPGDLRKNCARLRARGVEFSRPARESASGWDAEIRDPDGNLLLLVPAD